MLADDGPLLSVSLSLLTLRKIQGTSLKKIIVSELVAKSLLL